MHLNSLKTKYAYDPLGRRVKTTAGGSTVYHVYSGDECAADLDASGNPLRSYTFLLRQGYRGQVGQGIDNLLAVTVYTYTITQSGNNAITQFPVTYYAVKDHLGSVQALVNVSGSVVESYTYDAWGNTTIKNAGGAVIATSAYGNRYMFQGREYSTVTGLYNFRARWYAPTIGRWLSKDPIGLEGGFNLYEFCVNNPVNFVDKTGRSAISYALGSSAVFVPAYYLLNVVMINLPPERGGWDAATLKPFFIPVGIATGKNFDRRTPAVQEVLWEHESMHMSGFGELLAYKQQMWLINKYLSEGRYGTFLGEGGRCLTSEERQELLDMRQDVEAMIMWFSKPWWQRNPFYMLFN
jgi:RHS repeat-associated protein